jgi:hypothetical protein
MLIILAIAAVIVVSWFLADWRSRANFAKYSQESDRIISLLSKSDGVLEVLAPKTATSIDRGNGLINTWTYCGIDSGCNDSRRDKLVLIPRNHETRFFNSLLKNTGYEQGKPGECYPQTDNTTLGCSDIRNNSQFAVYFQVTAADPEHYGAPTKDDGVSANVWKYVSILVASD